jgi:hypothetical protein
MDEEGRQSEEYIIDRYNSQDQSRSKRTKKGYPRPKHKKSSRNLALIPG